MLSGRAEQRTVSTASLYTPRWLSSPLVPRVQTTIQSLVAFVSLSQTMLLWSLIEVQSQWHVIITSSKHHLHRTPSQPFSVRKINVRIIIVKQIVRPDSEFSYFDILNRMLLKNYMSSG